MLLPMAVLTERLATLSSPIFRNWELGIHRIYSFRPNSRRRRGCQMVLGGIFRKFGTPVSSELCLVAFPGWIGVLTRPHIAGCNAALVPVEVSDSSVTYDTSTYRDLAAAGAVVVQQCIANQTRGSGGWELAGMPFLVHVQPVEMSVTYAGFFCRRHGGPRPTSLRNRIRN